MKKRIFFFVLVLGILTTTLSSFAYADIGDNKIYEEESNDSLSTANNIYNGCTVFGALTPQDLDFYKFYAVGTSTISVACATGRNSVFVALIDANGNNIDVVKSTTYTDSENYYCELTSVVPAGQYYILVLDANDSSSNAYVFYFEDSSAVHTHIYSNDCDTLCTICNYERVAPHLFTNSCDTNCNVCGLARTVIHSFGEYVYNNNATTLADGTKTRSCTICGYSETVTAVGTKLPTPQPQPTPTPVEKPIVDTTKVFTDVAQDWYTQYINYAYTYSIFKGNEDGTFKPLSNITRAEFVQVLANVTGVDTSNKAVVTKFGDVKAGDWFAPAVKWANDNGIVAGKNDYQFAPEENITREQMCVMIVNYAKFKGITLKAIEPKEAFVDDAAISSWAKDAVYACQMADIVNGKGEGRFDPAGTGLRAEASVIFTKFHQNYLK